MKDFKEFVNEGKMIPATAAESRYETNQKSLVGISSILFLELKSVPKKDLIDLVNKSRGAKNASKAMSDLWDQVFHKNLDRAPVAKAIKDTNFKISEKVGKKIEAMEEKFLKDVLAEFEAGANEFANEIKKIKVK